MTSAPSGTGKTTIIQKLLSEVPNIRKIVTTTSRQPRPGETAGLDYHFVTRPEFEKLIEDGEFVEWKEHFGNLYGLTWAELRNSPTIDAIFDMDVFGKDEFLSQANMDCVTIFLAPPSIEAVEERIKSRGKYSEDEIRERVGRALEEMEHAETYDHIVVNHRIEDTVKEIVAVIEDARHPPDSGPRYVCIEGLVGAGKTTLTEILGPVLGAKLYLDPFERNPFLRDFYLSRRSFALETELSFALLRYRLLQSIKRDLRANRLIVSDFTMWRSYVFASTNLDEKAFDVFHKVYDVLIEDTPVPDLLVWIEAPYELLLKRIKTRGRAEEFLGVTEAYLRELNAHYKATLDREIDCEMVTVDAGDLDLLNSNRTLASLVEMIGGVGAGKA